MTRRHSLLALLAVVGLASGACARVQPATRTSYASFPADPSRAIVLSVLSDAVYLVDPVSGHASRLVAGLGSFQSGWATWAPDHRTLAWGDGGIRLFDTSTATSRWLTRGRLLSMPAFSPDGKLVAFGNGSALWTTPISRPDPRRLELPQGLAPLGMAWWSGSAIAFEGLALRCDGGACSSTGSSDIYTIAADGTGLRRLTRVGHAENPKWSPEGTSILFIRTVSSGALERSELWSVGIDAVGAHRLYPATDVVAAAWSPSGQSIAMVRRGSAPGTLQLWLMSADGSRAEPLGTSFQGSSATIDW